MWSLLRIKHNQAKFMTGSTNLFEYILVTLQLIFDQFKINPFLS